MVSRTCNLLSYITFAIVSLWSLFWCFFGLDFTDTFYHLNNALYSEHISVMQPLTSGFILLFNKLFGNYVIIYRLCNWLLIYIAYVLFYIIMRRTGVLGVNYVWLLCGTVVLIPLANWNIFNGNNLTTLFMVFTFAALHIYSSKKDNKWLLVIVFSVWLGIMSRFPNITIVLLVIMFGWMICDDVKDYLKIVMALVIAVALYFISCSIIFDGVKEYVTLMRNSISETSNSQNSNHSIFFLIGEYLHTLKDIVSDIKYLSIIAILPVLTTFWGNKWVALAISCISLLAHIVYIKIRVSPAFVLDDVLAYDLIVCFYAIIFIMIFIICVIAIFNRDIKMLGWGMMPLLFSLCSAAGSDTGLCLIGGQLYIYILFIWHMLERALNKNSNNISIIVISLFGLSICAFFYCRNNTFLIGVFLLILIFFILSLYPIKNKSVSEYNSVHRMENFKLGLIPIVVLCVCLAFIQRIFGPMIHDKSINKLTFQYEIPELRYVWTCKENVQFVNEVLNESNRISKNGGHIIFFGNQSVIFCYLYKTAMIEGVDFSMNDSERNVTAVMNKLSDRETLFLIPANPLTNAYFINDYPTLDSCMNLRGYTRNNKGLYAVYEKDMYD